MLLNYLFQCSKVEEILQNQAFNEVYGKEMELWFYSQELNGRNQISFKAVILFSEKNK